MTCRRGRQTRNISWEWKQLKPYFLSALLSSFKKGLLCRSLMNYCHSMRKEIVSSLLLLFVREKVLVTYRNFLSRKDTNILVLFWSCNVKRRGSEMLQYFHVLEMWLVELGQTGSPLLCSKQVCIIYIDVKQYESCNLKISPLLL